MIAQAFEEKPWVQSFDTWVLSQSLVLQFEISQTGRSTYKPKPHLFERLLTMVSGEGDFGYTIGGNKTIITSLAAIHQIARDKKPSSDPENIVLEADKIERALQLDELAEASSLEEEVQPLDQSSDHKRQLSLLHLRIFRNALKIYLHRTIFNRSPESVRGLVSTVLGDMVRFLDMKGGSISVWPVFIAAVEAYDSVDRDMVERWLDFSCNLGIENRRLARTIVKAVWERRDAEAEAAGVSPGSRIVDWKEVQKDMRLEILLL